jgi:hypothetical protein
MAKWWLVDGEQMAWQNPGTFEMPPRALRDRLDQHGPKIVLAKLIFKTDVPCASGPFEGATAERMWVLVEGRGSRKRYRGTVNNNPHFIPGLEAHQEVEFGPANVVQVDVAIRFRLQVAFPTQDHTYEAGSEVRIIEPAPEGILIVEPVESPGMRLAVPAIDLRDCGPIVPLEEL